MTELRTSPPPPNAQELHVWLLDTVADVRELRASLRKAIAEHTRTTDSGELAEVPENMVLVATELATNAIKYGRPPTYARLLIAGDQFVLEVADHDMTNYPVLADTRPLNAGGHGLMLALSFSLEVGWYATEDTKHVWATFPMR